jgi:uncharacterized protein (UPF0303 family)
MDHQEAKSAIVTQEALLERLPLDGKTLGALAQRLIDRAGAPLSVKIVVGRRTVVQMASDGTNARNDRFLDLKINTVLDCGHASLWWFHHLRATGRTLADLAWADPLEVIDMGGGVPLLRDGQIVGAVAVSGLPHEDDHALIIDAVRSMLET